jgi:transposase
MELFTLGIDLGKTTFHLVGMNQRGEVMVRKRFSRNQLLQFTANLKVELIGMEACGGSHFLGRALRLHRVRERWVMRRTAVVNQTRGLLLERGITLRKGRRCVDAALPGILTDPATKLSGRFLCC